MKRSFQDLRLRQLSDALAKVAPLQDVRRPPAGWIRAVRTALGMPQSFVADKLGVSRGAVAQYEINEKQQSITLETMRRVAAALECEFVYALVPRKPLDQLRLDQARKVATKTVQAVSQSMALEAQALNDPQTAQRIDELAKRLLDENPRLIWAVDQADARI